MSHLQVLNIPLQKTLKFLGVVFDEGFKWKAHFGSVSKRASSKLSILRQLKPFLTRGDLIIIFNNCIRSVLEYAAPLFVNVNTEQVNLFEKIQSRAHAIICGTSSCNCCDFIPLFYRRNGIGMRLFKILIKDSNHPLHYLTPETNSYSRTYRLPMIKAVIRSRSFIVTMTQLANNGF